MTVKVSGVFHPPTFDEAWLRRQEAPVQAELRALATESDAGLFYEGLLSLAARAEQRGAAPLAASCYQEVLAARGLGIAELQARARVGLEALAGRGPLGARAEGLLRDLARQSSDPAMLTAMFAAGTVFRLTRLATLSRLAAGPAEGILTRGLGARLSAGLAGFALEAPAFTLTHRLADEALGRPRDWDGTALGRDLASSYLVLGGLKLFGGLGAAATRGMTGGPLPALLRQGGTLGGILLGHRLETWAGLREPQSGAQTLVDSLALLLQFHVAGNLSRSLFGPGAQAWERDLDLRAEALARPRPIRASGLQPAFATAGNASLALPNHVAMSSNEFDPRLGGPVRSPIGAREVDPAAPEAVGEAAIDLLQELRVVRVPRTWKADPLAEGPRLWSYELLLEDLEALLQPGAERVIARRGGRALTLKLIHRGPSGPQNQFVPPGLPGYSFQIREGEHRGTVAIFLEPETLHLFSIQNYDGTAHEGEGGAPELLPGAGTMVMDWLASQAAARGQEFTVLGIQNPRVFRILTERGLFDPNRNLVEACRFAGRSGHRVVEMAPLRNEAFRARHWGKGFFNVRGRPNPGLLPTALRSTAVTRSFGPATEGPLEGLHSYEVQLDPIRNLLVPGASSVIARREGRELRWEVESVQVQDRANEFLEPGSVIVSGKLREGEGPAGSLKVYLHPERWELFSISTRDLPPGAGTLAMDWLATQAGVHGKQFGVLNIENLRILRILARSRLMEPTARVEECFRCSDGYEARTTKILGDFDPLRVNPFADFLVVRGRPHPALLPVEFRDREPD